MSRNRKQKFKWSQVEGKLKEVPINKPNYVSWDIETQPSNPYTYHHVNYGPLINLPMQGKHYQQVIMDDLIGGASQSSTTAQSLTDFLNKYMNLWRSSLIFEEEEMAYAYIKHDRTLNTWEISMELRRNFADIEKVVNVIKTLVPASHRSYEPITKTWTIDETFWEPIKLVTKSVFQIKDITPPETITPEDFFYEQTGSTSSNTETKESIAAKLETLLSVSVVNTPFDELKKAFRKKAMELHPDRNNGDGTKMSELNSLWSSFNAK